MLRSFGMSFGSCLLAHFYRYASADHLEWLEPVILRHEL
jgi:hypothetical protein